MVPFEPSTEDVADKILKAAIDYTISQDFAAGHTAEQGRRLQGFHGEGLASDPAYPSRGSHLTPGTGPLRDYQMQLMLLEQQNKKRLLMARDEAGYESESEELAQRRAEQLESSGKRRRLNPPANDENLTSTSATTGQVTDGLDQASYYEVPSLDYLSIQRTDVCRRSLAIFESSIRSIAIAPTNIATTVQIFLRTRPPQTF